MSVFGYLSEMKKEDALSLVSFVNSSDTRIYDLQLGTRHISNWQNITTLGEA